MTILFIILGVLIGTSLGRIVGLKIAGLPVRSNFFTLEKNRAEKHKQAELEHHRYMAPNQQTIDALEAEIFGVEKDIVNLPGYHWKVEPGKKEGFNITLINPQGKETRVVHVAEHKSIWKDAIYEGYYETVNRTEEELEAAFQETFKKMVDWELSLIRKAEMNKRLIEKYNGKAVVQDEVTL